MYTFYAFFPQQFQLMASVIPSDAVAMISCLTVAIKKVATAKRVIPGTAATAAG